MTSLQQLIDDMKARCEKATPGPWKHERCNDDSVIQEVSPQGWAKSPEYEWAYICKLGGWDYSLLHKNGEFIAHSRTDLPRALKVIEKLIQERNKYAADYLSELGPDFGEACKKDLEMSDDEIRAILSGETE